MAGNKVELTFNENGQQGLDNNRVLNRNMAT